MTTTFSLVLLSINIAQEGFPDDSAVKNLPAIQEMQETQIRSLGQKDPLEEGMATHSSILAGKCHGQRSLEGCSPQGHRVGHG